MIFGPYSTFDTNLWFVDILLAGWEQSLNVRRYFPSRGEATAFIAQAKERTQWPL